MFAASSPILQETRPLFSSSGIIFYEPCHRSNIAITSIFLTLTYSRLTVPVTLFHMIIIKKTILDIGKIFFSRLLLMGLRNFLIICNWYLRTDYNHSSSCQTLNPFANRDFILIAFLIALKPDELEKNANVTTKRRLVAYFASINSD